MIGKRAESVPSRGHCETCILVLVDMGTRDDGAVHMGVFQYPALKGKGARREVGVGACCRAGKGLGIVGEVGSCDIGARTLVEVEAEDSL